MNCPVCKTKTLSAHNLGENLQSLKCETCGGQWIGSAQFWKWRETHQAGHHEPAATGVAPNLKSGETKGPKVCPECAHILVSYKVGHSLDFSLDRCGTCGGVWFDKNEWEIIEGRNLKEEIHLIFSDAWQHRIRNEEHFKHLQQLLTEKIGVQDFEEIRRIKQWIRQHPHRQELQGYLGHEDF